MLDIASIFKNRIPNVPRLVAFGFSSTGNKYTISYKILNDQFLMNIAVESKCAISVRVLDAYSLEEYVLVHTPTAVGAFVGSVIGACEEKLKVIAENCFDAAVFRSEQAKQVILYAEQTHQNRPEFLWKSTPNNAVLRRYDNQKWYAALLTISKTKLGLDDREMAEVIDLRGLPEEIEQLVDFKNYFPGYHMNKKHWYTICLNGSVSMQELITRIEISYSLAKR